MSLPLVAVAATTSLSSCSLTLQSRPTNMSPQRIYAVAKPAMTLVQVDYKATISIPKFDVPKDRMTMVIDAVRPQVLSGKLDPMNSDAVGKALDREILSHPDKYFSPGSDTYTEDDQFELVGSGFIASREGFIATSAHVVATPDAEVKSKFVDEVNKSLSDPTVQADMAKTGDIPADLAPGYEAFVAAYVAKHITISNLSKEIHVAIGKGTPGKPVQANGLAATVAAAGSPVPGKDVAILKIAGKHDYATLPLGDDTKLHWGDPVTAVGFPGDSIFKNQDTDPREVAASESHGGVMLERPDLTGYRALGSEATTSPGMSGGPVMDNQGRVVGITAYGIAGKDGKMLPNQSYAVPVSVVRSYLAMAKAHPAVTDTTTAYRAGLAEYEQQHYRNALALFQQVKRDWPAQAFVQQYINDSEHGIVAGRDKSGPTTTQLAAIGGGIFVVLAALVVTTLLLVRRRRRRVVAAAEAPMSSPVAPAPLADAVPVETPAEPQVSPRRAARRRVAIAATEPVTITARRKAPARAVPAPEATGTAKSAVKPGVARRPVARAGAAKPATAQATSGKTPARTRTTRVTEAPPVGVSRTAAPRKTAAPGKTAAPRKTAAAPAAAPVASAAKPAATRRPRIAEAALAAARPTSRAASTRTREKAA